MPATVADDTSATGVERDWQPADSPPRFTDGQGTCWPVPALPGVGVSSLAKQMEHPACTNCNRAGRLLFSPVNPEVEYYRCDHCGQLWLHEKYHSIVRQTPSPALARTECPDCGGANVLDLADILYSPRVDYFRCRTCNCWWMVPKHADEPATRIVLGTPGS